MEILAILGVKNSNVYLNNNTNTVPSFTGCTGTCEISGQISNRTSWKVSLMVFTERES